MADLSADGYVKVWGEAFTEEWPLDSAAAQTVYRGQPVILIVGTDTVNAAAFVTATVVDSADIFLGVAAEGQTVATTDIDGGKKVSVYMEPTILGFQGSVYTDADVGDTIYMSDSGVLSATAADNPMLGKLHRVVDGYTYVQLITPTVTAGA